jgi:hypothetical protein
VKGSPSGGGHSRSMLEEAPTSRVRGFLARPGLRTSPILMPQQLTPPEGLVADRRRPFALRAPWCGPTSNRERHGLGNAVSTAWKGRHPAGQDGVSLIRLLWANAADSAPSVRGGSNSRRGPVRHCDAGYGGGSSR